MGLQDHFSFHYICITLVVKVCTYYAYNRVRIKALRAQGSVVLELELLFYNEALLKVINISIQVLQMVI